MDCECHGVELTVKGKCRVLQREYDRRYRRSPRGRALDAAYDKTPQGRKRHHKYNRTERGTLLSRINCRRYRQPSHAPLNDLTREHLIARERQLDALDTFIETGVSPWK